MRPEIVRYGFNHVTLIRILPRERINCHTQQPKLLSPLTGTFRKHIGKRLYIFVKTMKIILLTAASFVASAAAFTHQASGRLTSTQLAANPAYKDALGAQAPV